MNYWGCGVLYGASREYVGRGGVNVRRIHIYIIYCGQAAEEGLIWRYFCSQFALTIVCAQWKVLV